MKKKFKNWIFDVAVRTIKTMAQAALGAGIGTAATMQEVNWSIVGSTVLISGIACIIFNISNLEIKKEEGKQ